MQPLTGRQDQKSQLPQTNGNWAFIGLSLASHNISDWAGGVRRFRREKEQISRAEFKMLEAFEAFTSTCPPAASLLDLGAAPGGWTRVLRQKGQYVTAVDPAELHPRLRRRPRRAPQAHDR